MSLHPPLHWIVNLDPHLGDGEVLVVEDCVLHFHPLLGLPDHDAGSQVAEHLDRCLVLVVVELLVLVLGVLHHRPLLGGESFCKHSF